MTSVLAIIALVIFFGIFFSTGKLECTLCGTRMKKEDLAYYNFHEIAAAHSPLKGMGFCCAACAGKVEEAKRLVAAAKENAPTQTWPATYKGKIPVVPGSEQPRVYSGWHKEKDAARDQLLVTSAYLSSDINAVKELEYEKGTGSTGNYRYTEWRASGIPCKVQ